MFTMAMEARAMRLLVESDTVPRIDPVAESWAARDAGIAIRKRMRAGRETMRVVTRVNRTRGGKSAEKCRGRVIASAAGASPRDMGNQDLYSMRRKKSSVM